MENASFPALCPGTELLAVTYLSCSIKKPGELVIVPSVTLRVRWYYPIATDVLGFRSSQRRE